MSNYFSYQNVIDDIRKFRSSGTKFGGDFNLTDTTGRKYFKIFFYFNNGDAEGISSSSHNGLLAPTWYVSGVDDSNYYMYNSAWSYLKMNYEDERADLLKQFVTLLSNISSESPWYFSEIAGLDSALDRQQTMVHDFKFEEERKKISIKCLPDAADDRIGTLLDLYRSIVWSWQMKREVLPANLKKFDMGIFIFDTPTIPYDTRPKTSEYNKVGDTGHKASSYKYIEFHNCEFDYNSVKSPLSTLNNKEGIELEYTIDILFDDCYETRYNAHIGKILGDLIKWDLDYNETYSEFDEVGEIVDDYSDYYNELPTVMPDNMKIEERVAQKTLPKTGFLQTAVNELAGHAKQFVGGIVKKAVLGNMHTFSLAKAVTQVKDVLGGHVFAAASAVKSYQEDKSISNKVKRVNKIGNMYSNETIKNSI